MATIAPTLPRSGTVRSPTRVWVLAVGTLGVYAVRHHYVINCELRDFGVDVRPVASVLALFPGVLVIVPALVTLSRTALRIGVAQETIGLVPTTNPRRAALSLVLALFVPYHQHEVNRVWREER
jgi:hypothetical protein